MFTVITGLVYKDQSTTKITENKVQRENDDKEDTMFTGHRAQL